MRCGIFFVVGLPLLVSPSSVQAASPTSVTIGVSPSPALFGKSVTITATVSPMGATGSVTFYNGVSVLGSSNLISGHASLVTGLLPCCAVSLTARYNGSPSSAPSSSAATQERILVPAMNGFSAPATSSTGENPSSIAAGDFNGDGIPDLVLTNSGNDGVTVLIGVGDGTFQAAAFDTTGYGAYAVAVGDFNGDGKADLVVANDAASTISVLLGVGNGTFAAAIDLPLSTPNDPYAIVTGDFNGDGRLDVATANFGDNTVSIFLGNGDGTLAAPISVAAGSEPAALVTADFNGDGKTDLAVADLDTTTNTLTILLGNGDGTFNPLTPISGGLGPDGIVAADFNGDGKIDLAVADYGDFYSNIGNVLVFLGNGDGTFQTPIQSATVFDPQGISAGDLNGDGKLDLAVTSDGGVSILYGKGDGTFQTPAIFPAGSASTSAPSSMAVALADFNGDSFTDIAVANYEDNNAGVLLGEIGTCSFTISPVSSVFDANGGSFPLSVNANSPGCAWSSTVTSSLTLTPSSGYGTSTVTVTVLPNTTGQAVTGTLTIGGQTATVGQWETAQTFNDVPISAYYFDGVNLLKSKNITSGCGFNDFCPTLNVTRAQMAIFIVRAIIGSDNFTWSPTPHFNDVPSNAFGFSWIQKLFELNITAGCGNSDYCPNDSITRDQMAVFIIRARFGATVPFTFPATPKFADVPSSYFAFQWIQRMALDLITSGCGYGDYCPANPVSRGDMALFIMRGAFNQLLPAGTPVISQVSPATITRGQTATVTVTGTSTGFAQGQTVINPIPGIQIGLISVTGPTTLSVPLTANANAVPQPVSLVVVTGAQQAIVPNGLTIE